MCHEAYSEGRKLHKSVLDIMYGNRMNGIDYIIGIVKFYLNSLTFHQLKTIALTYRTLNIFASNLYHNYLITLSQTGYRTKKDLLVILGYFYRYLGLSYMPRSPDVVEQLRQFEHPGRNRPYGQDIQPGPRKFSIETKIVACKEDSKFECPICYDEIEDCKRVTTNCNHDVCGNCMETYLTGVSNYNFKNPLCCMCRVPIKSITFTDELCMNNIKNKLVV